MKTIDKLGLQMLSEIIMESISTSGIYCFGEKKQSQTVQNPFQETASVQEEHTHFYILVFANEYVINAVTDISDIIKTKTEGRYTVTLLLHKATTVQHLAPHQLYFYHEVITKGNKIYEHENVPPNIAFDETPKRQIKYLRSHWNNRNIVAETFLRSLRHVDYTDYGFVQESMMHIAIEQTCLGLIDVFLGYRPDHFSLPYLFDLCEIFTPLASDLFPRTTIEDKRLFDLLKANTSALRWVNLKKSCIVDTEFLEKRSNLFHERACRLIESELERLETLELNRQSNGNK
ncbi:hypothetical protein [Flavobacterium sp. 5]|uniref:hypothetical protein n=1 Tax=Flavobacterium sp. 5 TaxID=2035199 RepID=UPI000C2CA8A1|nr:hypothetical protein [Flavobacterium sp. 5]PKB18828.1 hypothetical protein CLU82_4122 [Flavobacterium sp. 5]